MEKYIEAYNTRDFDTLEKILDKNFFFEFIDNKEEKVIQSKDKFINNRREYNFGTQLNILNYKALKNEIIIELQSSGEFYNNIGAKPPNAIYNFNFNFKKNKILSIKADTLIGYHKEVLIVNKKISDFFAWVDKKYQNNWDPALIVELSREYYKSNDQ